MSYYILTKKNNAIHHITGDISEARAWLAPGDRAFATYDKAFAVYRAENPEPEPVDLVWVQDFFSRKPTQMERADVKPHWGPIYENWADCSRAAYAEKQIRDAEIRKERADRIEDAQIRYELGKMRDDLWNIDDYEEFLGSIEDQRDGK